MIRPDLAYFLVDAEHVWKSAEMETRKICKHVEVQFVSNQDIGRDIVSIKDTKVKKIGTNVNTNFWHACALTPLIYVI
jgi:hypothetical protein